MTPTLLARRPGRPRSILRQPDWSFQRDVGDLIRNTELVELPGWPPGSGTRARLATSRREVCAGVTYRVFERWLLRRAEPNVSRSVSKLIAAGFVRLRPGAGKTKVPVA